MKRFFAAAAGGLGVAALLRRRRRSAPDPATELREKLAESKSIVDERDADEVAETRVDEAVPPPPLQDRRAEVHERARQAMDELG